MPQNNARYTGTWAFACQDGTPLYLTENGLSGGTPLVLDSWWRLGSPYSDPSLKLSTAGGELQILDAPNDNQLYVDVSSDLMKTLAAGTYVTDIIATVDGEQVSKGSYEIPVEQGSTDLP